MAKELIQNQFQPVNREGKNPVTSGGEILAWKYKPQEKAPDKLTENIIVAKPPGTGDQYIVGPESAVIATAQAFNILDAKGFGHIREANVVISPYFYSDQDWEQRYYGEFYISELMHQFGLHHTLIGSQYLHHGEYEWMNVVPHGAIVDLKKPLFGLFDFKTNKYWPKVPDAKLQSIYFAGFLIHEWQHVLQARNDLPTYSLWAERDAMSYECDLRLNILRNDSSLNEEQKSDLAKSLQTRSQSISDYRNGRGFKEHLIAGENRFSGTPLKRNSLEREDFAVGF